MPSIPLKLGKPVIFRPKYVVIRFRKQGKSFSTDLQGSSARVFIEAEQSNVDSTKSLHFGLRLIVVKETDYKEVKGEPEIIDVDFYLSPQEWAAKMVKHKTLADFIEKGGGS